MQPIKIRNILDLKNLSGIITIKASAPLSEFIKVACEKRIGALVVTDEKGGLAGIISERDVLYQCNKNADFARTTIGEVMTKNVVTIKVDDDIVTAMDMMFQKNIRHLPVMDGQKIMGMIAIRDVIHAIRDGDEAEKRAFVEYLQSTADKNSES